MWRRLPLPEPARHKLVWAVGLRLLLLAAFCTVHRNFTPYIRAISEADMLAHYRRPRRASIVPSWLMMAIIIFIPLLMFSVPTLLTNRYLDITHVLLGWSLAITMNALITEVLKLAVGRPRPDYFYRCFPDGKIAEGLCCTGSLQEMMEGRKSFPSGHSSFSFCSLGFLSLWLCGRLGAAREWQRRGWARRRGAAARAALSGSPILLAALIAASRCLDNHHHWQDVVCGAVLGLLVAHASYTCHYHPVTSPLAGLPLHATEAQRTAFFQVALASGDILTDYIFRSRIDSEVFIQIK